MAEIRRLAIILGIMVVTLSISYARVAYAEHNAATVVNGKQLSQKEYVLLMRLYGRVLPGRFWYDRFSGLFGYEGGPALGQMHPRLPVGGRLRADASGGQTNVFLNGRALHPVEIVRLRMLFGQVIPGRYWMNAAGIGGPEGSPPTFNLAQAAQRSGLFRQGNGVGEVHPNGATSYRNSNTGVGAIINPNGGGHWKDKVFIPSR